MSYRIGLAWASLIAAFIGTQVLPEPWGWIAIAVMVVAGAFLIIFSWKDWYG